MAPDDYCGCIQIIAGCCSADMGACSDLLAANPDLSVDPDTTFNFCNLHGNVCTRCDGHPIWPSRCISMSILSSLCKPLGATLAQPCFKRSRRDVKE